MKTFGDGASHSFFFFFNLSSYVLLLGQLGCVSAESQTYLEVRENMG